MDAELNEARSRMEQQADALMRNPLNSSSLSDAPGVVCGVGGTFQKSGGGFLVSGLDACGEEVLQMGDLALAIDDVPLAHLSSVEFRQKIQGPAGTRVSLLIVRQHSSHGATMPPFDLVVTRRAWMSAPVAALPHQLPPLQAQQPEADLVRWVNRPDSTIGITPLMISAFRPDDAAILPHHHHQQNAPNSMPAGSADDYTPSPFAHTGVASHEAHHQAQYDVLAQVGAHQGTPQGTHDDDLVAHQGTYCHAEVPKTVSVETRVSVGTHGLAGRHDQVSLTASHTVMSSDRPARGALSLLDKTSSGDARASMSLLHNSAVPYERHPPANHHSERADEKSPHAHATGVTLRPHSPDKHENGEQDHGGVRVDGGGDMTSEARGRTSSQLLSQAREAVDNRASLTLSVTPDAPSMVGGKVSRDTQQPAHVKSWQVSSLPPPLSVGKLVDALPHQVSCDFYIYVFVLHLCVCVSVCV